MRNFLLPIFILAVPLFANAGFSTNGSSFAVDQDNAWYLGTEPVEYCIERSRTFQISEERARALVKQSIRQWQDFFAKYGLDKMTFDNLKGGRALGISLNFREVDRCTRPATQLHFLFGIDTPTVSKALEVQNHALALSVRDDYNHETYRNGGAIWIRPWTFSELELHHLLLHEIGHVLGMPHDSVHVMDTSLADLIVGKKGYGAVLGEIESPTWPYRLEDGDTMDFTFNGRRSGAEPNVLLAYVRDAFGFSRENTHTAKLTAIRSQSPLNSWNMSLTFREVETGKEAVLKGQFIIKPMVSNQIKGLHGPVLYTAYYCTTCGFKGTDYRRHLDPRPDGLDADGSFTYQDRIYPAILAHRRGSLLKVFAPEKKGWWTVEGYVSTYYLD